MRGLAANMVEHGDRLVGHVAVVKRRFRIGGTTVAAPVERDELVLIAEVREHAQQTVAVGETAVEQQDRCALTVAFYPGWVAVDCDVVAHEHLRDCATCRARWRNS